MALLMLVVGMGLSSCSSDDDNDLQRMVTGTMNSDQKAASNGGWDFYAICEGDTIYFKIDKSNAGECYVVHKNYDQLTSWGDPISAEGLYSGDITIPEIVTLNGTQYLVTGIGQRAFSYSQITSLNMPSTIRYIDYCAIGWCYELTSVKMPADLIEIEGFAFTCDTLLTNVTLPSKLEKIYQGAFVNCYRLQSINIPASVTYIESATIANCKNMTTIDVDKNNQYYQFKDGMLLNKAGNFLHTYLSGNKATSFTIPEYVDSLGEYAFLDCEHLKSLTVNSNITWVTDYSLCGIPNIEKITLPNTITHIGNYAFGECPALTDFVLPESVTYIDERAFWGLESLEEINIPAAVTNIGEFAFFNCSSLKTVKCYILEPFAIDNFTFTDYYLTTLYVPTGTKTLYRNTDGWKNFDSIVEM